MPLLASECDISFYNMMHRVAAQKETERRTAAREPFQCTQRIALRRGPSIPADHEFTEIRCHDLTTGGFSFLYPRHPPFSQIVVEFAFGTELLYVAAEIAHCSKIFVYPTGDVLTEAQQAQTRAATSARGEPRTMVLVGCRFTERLAR